MTNEPEFEMLVNVIIAQHRIVDATEWSVGGPEVHAKLKAACTALEDVKLSCSIENQRLARMRVDG